MAVNVADDPEHNVLGPGITGVGEPRNSFEILGREPWLDTSQPKAPDLQPPGFFVAGNTTFTFESTFPAKFVDGGFHAPR